MKNGSDAVDDADATINHSVMLIVKHLTKKRADAEKENGSDAETSCRKEKKRQYKNRIDEST